ncbi:MULTISPECIES: MFS transporter [Marinobacter]|jgi:DHA1 family inner membrane transport protein|uniref:Inner membrane transport protein YdhP n=1 Tax=Marinobacter salarius TaxID=1420917 RepID=A0A1W6KAJ4_9GAMM|nr:MULTISPECIES: MFS transporter [Marinobacter]ARM84329.1 inner membrane transport protein YdhP [Marinobacter salarius]OLF84827.1 MFS transporter [Marinobacter sp. C18]|tara:strand:- start:3156 stop:4376 length:1221 start_codon:yes stop_codon:yes gene_type:complete
MPSQLQEAPYSPARITLIIFSLAMGGFGIGTGEFAIMGLMPGVAADLGVTEPQVGHLISAYALGVVVGAPLLAIGGARLYRRHLLILLMSFYALGNIASALAPGYGSLLVFRFIAGLPHGAYFGVAALVAASLVPFNKRAKVVSLVMMGLTLALLIGNPLATILGQHLDWRYAFGFVGAIAALTGLMIVLFLPLNRQEERQSPFSEIRAFNRPEIWYPLAIGSIGFAGMFCVFSYMAPTLLEVTGVNPFWIPIALAVFGLGGFVGNILGGWLFDRLQFRSVGWMLLWSISMLLLYPYATETIWTMLVMCFLVALMVGLGPALQTHLMDVAHGAQTLAAASHHAAFNVANALGPWLGGMAISAGLGWQSTGYVGATTAVAGLAIFLLAWRQQSGPERVDDVALSQDS